MTTEADLRGWRARWSIQTAGTCDGCGEDRLLVRAYDTVDGEPWLCRDCDLLQPEVEYGIRYSGDGNVGILSSRDGVENARQWGMTVVRRTVSAWIPDDTPRNPSSDPEPTS